MEYVRYVLDSLVSLGNGRRAVHYHMESSYPDIDMSVSRANDRMGYSVLVDALTDSADFVVLSEE